VHPDIFSLRWESQFIVAKNGLVDVVGSDFGDAKLAKFLELIRGRWFERTLNSGKPNEYSAGLVDDISATALEQAIEEMETRLEKRDESPARIAAEFVRALFDGAAVSAGAGRWCEKTPRNSIYMARIAEMFPEARFINVIRDGRDVACSMVERSFWPIGATHDFPTTNQFRGEVTFDKAISYWAEMIRLSREVAEQLQPGRYLEIRLEDLVFDQDGAVERVAAFLEEPLAAALLEFEMRSTSIGRWREELDDSQVALADELAGDLLRLEGYAV
jgi:hypothetical protein